jgi:hypothetical protein
MTVGLRGCRLADCLCVELFNLNVKWAFSGGGCYCVNSGKVNTVQQHAGTHRPVWLYRTLIPSASTPSLCLACLLHFSSFTNIIVCIAVHDFRHACTSTFNCKQFLAFLIMFEAEITAQQNVCLSQMVQVAATHKQEGAAATTSQHYLCITCFPHHWHHLTPLAPTSPWGDFDVYCILIWRCHKY